MWTERLKISYKAIRSILFSAIIVVGLLFFTLYVLLAIPAVQRKIGDIATRELSAFLGGEVTVGEVSIFPFNEVVVGDVVLKTPGGEECVKISRLGAGISLWTLFTERRIEISYAEVIGLDARVWKETPQSDLNIRFLIDAFAPKDKNKPPAKFDLKIHNVVIRRSALSYDNRWVERKGGPDRFDPDHIRVGRLNADVMLPRLSNRDFQFDVRRISLRLCELFELKSLRFKGQITDNEASLKGFSLELPHSVITVNDQNLTYSSLSDLKEQLMRTPRCIELHDARVTPSDFAIFLPQLRELTREVRLNVNVCGSPDNVESFDLRIVPDNEDSFLSLSGSALNLRKKGNLDITVDNLQLAVKNDLLHKLCGMFPASDRERIAGYITALGEIDLQLSGRMDQRGGIIETGLTLRTFSGALESDLRMMVPLLREMRFNRFKAEGKMQTENIDLSGLMEQVPASELSAGAEFNIEVNNGVPTGVADCEISHVVFNGHTLENIVAKLEKNGDELDLELDSDNPALGVQLNGCADIGKKDPALQVFLLARNIDLDLLPNASGLRDCSIAGRLEMAVTGNDPETLCGTVTITDLLYTRQKESLMLDHLDMSLQENPDTTGGRLLEVDSDWFDIKGNIDFPVKQIASALLAIVKKGMPMISNYIPAPKHESSGHSVRPGSGSAGVDIILKPVDTPYKFFNIGVSPLVESTISASMDLEDETIRVNADFPYIRQGKNKLISSTGLTALIDGIHQRGDVSLHTIYPAKKGDAEIDLNLSGADDRLKADIGFNKSTGGSFHGSLGLETFISRDDVTGKEKLNLTVNPSSFMLNGAEWKVAPAEISYSDRKLIVDHLNIFHEDQFIDIRGVGSSSITDELTVRLAGIDLDYIFDTLNINYVTFGGTATGEVMAAALFSGSPVMQTRGLHVRNLSYNGGVLGDGDLTSSFDVKEKKVNILADIREKGERKATVDGGIWVTRDSLSFSLQANKVDIEFLKPFMSSFTSEVSGRASGNAKLYGTFSDIDLVGRLFADTIRMKVDYTNVVYAGSDSVIMTPGRIEIPNFRLYDRNGNSGVLSGVVRHRYFHEPSFEFNLREAENLLCYDTNASMNEMWYGTIYGSGGGRISGDNSEVDIDIDMTTRDNSDFTFVLTDTQEASEYKFLNFTDRRKEKQMQVKDSAEPDFIAGFRRQIRQEESSETQIVMDIRASITPEATLTIVMDPVAGDKIQANGNGAMQIEYDSGSDEMRMYGKFSLEQGHYNFSLQDIILRDFSIKPGSTISFNGDPLDGVLDIAATYRVNTNLSDLDKSFSTDRDLNRTNVPVDAVLVVKGPMTTPAISFDIDLPTLTDEVERKVRSIISTDDQMSRQIIYLLALNRFYTPEYMGSSSNGGEWASVASSTISSQISNMLGQLTDKVSVMPSFRSDKGDFSDMEVDLALSSKLLNNRLLLNGNFGYRDKSTSTTTFIGDFDIEYVLTRNGALRLKAYNHFNDENYYLKSSLTTQGVGIVVRKDFDSLNFLKFFRRKGKKTTETGDGRKKDKK